MKTTIFELGAILLASSVADAKPTSIYKTTGTSAYGNVETYSDCGYTSLSVSYDESATKEGSGKPKTSKSICFTMSEYDFCSDEFNYSSKWACDIPGSVSGNINKGISISVDDYVVLHSDSYYNGNEESGDLTVYLKLQADWEPNGVTSSGHSTYRNILPGYRYVSRYSGTSRDAHFALSAFVDDENVAPSSPDYSWGSLYKSTSGSVCHGECY